MRNNYLHIIEPTLYDQTGHCYALVMDLINNGLFKDVDYQVWMNKRAESLFGAQCKISENRYFSRRLRRIEAFFLYRKLILKEERFFISTATTTDMQLLHWAFSSQKKILELNAKNIKLYIHWLYPSRRKLYRLKKIALRYPNLNLACPTRSVKDMLNQVGFNNVELVSYPSAKYEANKSLQKKNVFSKVLFAGAARVDKGFPLVVEMVALLNDSSSEIPLTIQCSTTHKGVHGEEISTAIKRLQSINYSFLNCFNETLDRADYQSMIMNSILIQPYDVEQFADRVSGVTLDALKVGSPIIVPANTWMARIVERFDVGVIVEKSDDPSEWVQAIKSVISRWRAYSDNAMKASADILSEHSPEKLASWLFN